MNFIFISPNYPHTWWQFCDRLQKNGVNVLGIGDAPYFHLSEAQRNVVTEYYYVNSLKDYDQVYRAVAFFAFKYGKIDWLESNNEYWLEQDARLRTDFHITTGLGEADYASIREGFPAVPEDAAEAEHCSYDVITDSGCNPLFEAMTVWPEISGAVTPQGFFTCCEIPEALRSRGREVVRACGQRSRIVRLNCVQLKWDLPGIGRAGEWIPVHAGRHSAFAFAPDVLNFAYATDVYQIWADMVAYDKRLKPEGAEHCCCAFAGRGEESEYLHNREEIFLRYGGRLALCEELPESLWGALGCRSAFALRAQAGEDPREFIRFLREKR